MLRSLRLILLLSYLLSPFADTKKQNLITTTNQDHYDCRSTSKTMKLYSDFHGGIFQDNVEEALKSVRRILDVDRGPSVRLAEDVDHSYVDKYRLADLLTNTAIVALMNVFEQFGLTKEVFQKITIDNTTGSKQETTLRFHCSESCTLVNEETVEEPMGISKETKKSRLFGQETTTKEERMMRRVNVLHYKIERTWELSIYSGTDVPKRTIIKKRKTTIDLADNFPSSSDPETKRNRIRKALSPQDFELSLTWFLQQIDAQELTSHFAIDTSPDNAKTKTPTRNFEVEQATSFFDSARMWSQKVCRLFAYCSNYQTDNLSGLKAKNIFVPVIPLMVDPKQLGAGLIKYEAELLVEGEAIDTESKSIFLLPSTKGDDSSVLSVADMTSFLNEQARTLAEMQDKLDQDFPDPKTEDKLVSSVEAMIYLLGGHTRDLASQFHKSMMYIEAMLEKQLVAAIGKKVTSTDLDNFVRYHNEKWLTPSTKRFCNAIRRPGHYPDGILSIEEEAFNNDYTSTVEPISTHVRELTSVDPINIPLNAATTLALTGKTYLHGWLNHRFGNDRSKSIRLNARARQFSSFVLLVGTMTSQNRMQPKDAIILRNKDEVHIPLLLNEIPTAKEFKDAIGSLSPEQQRFAKSFRLMQLDSSVLGVCIIQIKPQLEKLLGLPEGSLTKEIKLTEDLMELFVEYQVPSDLLTCDFVPDGDGDGDSDGDGDWVGLEGKGKGNHKSVNIKDQVANVQEHVKSVLDIIATQKKEQLEEQAMKTGMAILSKHEQYDSYADYNDDGGEGNECEEACMPPAALSLQRDPPPVPYSGRKMKLRSGKMHCGLMPPKKYIANTATPSSSSKSSPRATGSDFKKESDPSPLETGAVDFAAMPKVLDRVFELHDKSSALRSTTIETANSGWTRIRQENLLSKTSKGSLEKDSILSEKSKAFDLLDALSRSGSLGISYSELHVLICATHRFEKNVMETVIRDNINPIEKLEMSTLLMASTILGIPAKDLIRSGKDRKRLEASFPLLLGVASDNDNVDDNVDDNADDNADDNVCVFSSSTPDAPNVTIDDIVTGDY